MQMVNEHDLEVSGQPEEWEELLKDVTVFRDRREILFDPMVLPILEEKYRLPDISEVTGQEEACVTLDRDVERIRRAAERKLSGKIKDCVMLYLLTGWSNARIGAALNTSKDTVRRAVEAGIEKLKTYFAESAERTFPQFHRSRKILRAAILPLDTHEERKTFQDFVNENIVVHLAYSGGDDFREAIVVYTVPSGRGKSEQQSAPTD